MTHLNIEAEVSFNDDDSYTCRDISIDDTKNIYTTKLESLISIYGDVTLHHWVFKINNTSIILTGLPISLIRDSISGNTVIESKISYLRENNTFLLSLKFEQDVKNLKVQLDSDIDDFDIGSFETITFDIINLFGGNFNENLVLEPGLVDIDVIEKDGMDKFNELYVM